MPFLPVKWAKPSAHSKHEGDGLGSGFPQTLWLPVLAQVSRGQCLGQAVLWLSRDKPQTAICETVPCSPLCTGPSSSGVCGAALRLLCAPRFTFGVQHRGQEHYLQ